MKVPMIIILDTDIRLTDNDDLTCKMPQHEYKQHETLQNDVK